MKFDRSSFLHPDSVLHKQQPQLVHTCRLGTHIIVAAFANSHT